MDNMRFDPLRFSPDELPSLEQLQREQSFAARSDADFPPDYQRQDYRQPYMPQQGYAPGYPYAPQPSYAPGYPYATGYPQPETPRGYETQMQQPYVPQHAAYMPQHAAFAPPYGADPRAFGQMPGYADDPYYRPQHMKEPQPFAEEPPRYGDVPGSGYGRDVYAAAPQQPEAPASFDALPSLDELQQALQAERQAEAQRAMEAQRAAMEAQRREREQRERAAMQQRQMQQQMQQSPAPAGREPARTPEYPASQAPKRFVIEDLEPDGDEDSHTKRKHFLPTEEKSQFSSLLRRFRQKNS